MRIYLSQSCTSQSILFIVKDFIGIGNKVYLKPVHNLKLLLRSSTPTMSMKREVFGINLTIQSNQSYNIYPRANIKDTCKLDVIVNYSWPMNIWDSINPDPSHWNDYEGVVKQAERLEFTYNNRLHTILNFKRETNNINRQEAIQKCQTVNKANTLFTFFTQEELRHVVNQVTHYGIAGAPLLIFTGFRQDIKVCNFKDYFILIIYENSLNYLQFYCIA